MIKTISLDLATRGNADCQDITDSLSRAVAESELRSGTLTVFCPSSTSGITTIEFESGAIQDLRRVLDDIVPPSREYAHNARWGDANGHSHVRAALLGPSITVPFVNGALTLGTWQQVIYMDFDTHPRHRRLVVQLIGE